MSDTEPSMRLTNNGQAYEATPDNTSLFMFVGSLAVYNHVFIQTDKDNALGMYIFERVLPEPFTQMRDYMLPSGYPLHANLRDVAQCDIAAYETAITAMCADVSDTIPDDWSA